MPLDNLELLEPLDPEDTLVGGGTGRGGHREGGVLAHKLEALSYSTLALLEEPFIPTKEVEPITCVCREFPPEYSTNLTYRDGVQGSAFVHGAEYEGPLQGSS